jgi:hypothetical protein
LIVLGFRRHGITCDIGLTAHFRDGALFLVGARIALIA